MCLISLCLQQKEFIEYCMNRYDYIQLEDPFLRFQHVCIALAHLLIDIEYQYLATREQYAEAYKILFDDNFILSI